MNLNLITAVLMTMAAIAWTASAFLKGAGDSSFLSVMVAIAFAVLAILYWVLYFQRRNTATGDE